MAVKVSKLDAKADCVGSLLGWHRQIFTAVNALGGYLVSPVRLLHEIGAIAKDNELLRTLSTGPVNVIIEFDGKDETTAILDYLADWSELEIRFIEAYSKKNRVFLLCSSDGNKIRVYLGAFGTLDLRITEPDREASKFDTHVSLGTMTTEEAVSLSRQLRRSAGDSCGCSSDYVRLSEKEVREYFLNHSFVRKSLDQRVIDALKCMTSMRVEFFDTEPNYCTVRVVVDGLIFPHPEPAADSNVGVGDGIADDTSAIQSTFSDSEVPESGTGDAAKVEETTMVPPERFSEAKIIDASFALMTSGNLDQLTAYVAKSVRVDGGCFSLGDHASDYFDRWFEVALTVTKLACRGNPINADAVIEALDVGDVVRDDPVTRSMVRNACGAFKYYAVTCAIGGNPFAYDYRFGQPGIIVRPSDLLAVPSNTFRSTDKAPPAVVVYSPEFGGHYTMPVADWEKLKDAEFIEIVYFDHLWTGAEWVFLHPFKSV